MWNARTASAPEHQREGAGQKEIETPPIAAVQPGADHQRPGPQFDQLRKDRSEIALGVGMHDVKFKSEPARSGLRFSCSPTPILTAGASGFLNLSQSGERPDR